MLEPMEGKVCLLEVLEVMRCMLFCMLEAVEISKFPPPRTHHHTSRGMKLSSLLAPIGTAYGILVRHEFRSLE